MDSLAHARQLYEQMDFSNFAIVDKPKSYTLGKGKMRMTVVYTEDDVEVLQGECQPGCRVEPHTHGQEENILCYEGGCVVTVEGSKHVLRPGVTVAIPIGAIHYTTSDAGCKVLVARIPPIKDIY